MHLQDDIRRQGRPGAALVQQQVVHVADDYRASSFAGGAAQAQSCGFGRREGFQAATGDMLGRGSPACLLSKGGRYLLQEVHESVISSSSSRNSSSSSSSSSSRRFFGGSANMVPCAMRQMQHAHRPA